MSPFVQGEGMFPDWEPVEVDRLCQGCQEHEAEPYESYCDDCLGVISDAAGDLCSVPAAIEEEPTACRDCGEVRFLPFLGRCGPCDRIKFPPRRAAPPPPPIPPFEQEATSHPRILTNA